MIDFKRPLVCNGATAVLVATLSDSYAYRFCVRVTRNGITEDILCDANGRISKLPGMVITNEPPKRTSVTTFMNLYPGGKLGESIHRAFDQCYYAKRSAGRVQRVGIVEILSVYEGETLTGYASTLVWREGMPVPAGVVVLSKVAPKSPVRRRF